MTMRTFAFTLFCSALPLLAQEPDAARPAAAKARPEPVLVTMKFAGGTLAEFCDHIRATEPRVNIVLAPLAATAKLPVMDLRGAGLEQALESACMVAESTAVIRIKDFRGPGEPVFTITATESAKSVGGMAPSGQPDGTAPVGQVRAEKTEVFSLNRLLDPKDGSGFAVTTVLSAIETATGGEQGLAAMRFHKESGLLIVRGRGDQLALVRDVLANLDRDVMDRRKQENARKGIPSEPAKEAK